MAFDVFISYASKDKIVADAVWRSSNRQVFAAGSRRATSLPALPTAKPSLSGAKVMVLVFSSNANASGHIPKEVERAVSNGVAILPFRIEDVAPGKSLDYFIGSVHWLDAMTPPMEKHLVASPTVTLLAGGTRLWVLFFVKIAVVACIAAIATGQVSACKCGSRFHGKNRWDVVKLEALGHALENHRGPIYLELQWSVLSARGGTDFWPRCAQRQCFSD